MVRQDILGALQSALTRGETLKRAMMTLYNSGYKKEEIEEAAAALQQITQQQRPVAQTKTSQSIQQPVQQKFEKPSSKIKIILIIFILVILIGLAIGGFLFKVELIGLFNNLFN